MAKCRQNQASLMMFFAHSPPNMALLAIALLLMAGILGTTPDPGPTTDEVLQKRANGDRGKAPAVNQTQEWDFSFCKVWRVQLSKAVSRQPEKTCEDSCQGDVFMAYQAFQFSRETCIVPVSLQPRCVTSSAHDLEIACTTCEANFYEFRRKKSFTEDYVDGLNWKCQSSTWLAEFRATLQKERSMFGIENVAKASDVYRVPWEAAFRSWDALLAVWDKRRADCTNGEHVPFRHSKDDDKRTRRKSNEPVSNAPVAACVCLVRLFFVAYQFAEPENPYDPSSSVTICNAGVVKERLKRELSPQPWSGWSIDSMQSDIGCSWQCSCDNIKDLDGGQAMCSNWGEAPGATRSQFDSNVTPDPDWPGYPGWPQSFV